MQQKYKKKNISIMYTQKLFFILFHFSFFHVGCISSLLNTTVSKRNYELCYAAAAASCAWILSPRSHGCIIFSAHSPLLKIKTNDSGGREYEIKSLSSRRSRGTRYEDTGNNNRQTRWPVVNVSYVLK